MKILRFSSCVRLASGEVQPDFVEPVDSTSMSWSGRAHNHLAHHCLALLWLQDKSHSGWPRQRGHTGWSGDG